jgi:hypothetical protein
MSYISEAVKEHWGARCPDFDADCMTCAAWAEVDTLEALQRENEALREALKPFALVAEYDIGEDETDNDRFQPMSFENSRVKLLNVGDLRRARTALASAGGEHHADK